MRRKPTKSEINSHKEKILDLLLKRPMTPNEMYEHMDANIAYQALMSLEIERKVRNEGLTYYLNPNGKRNTKPKPTTTTTGKPAEHRLRAKKYGGELNDPTTRGE